MKRSFALIGFTYFVTLTAAIYFKVEVSTICSIFLLVLFVASMFFQDARKKKVLPIAFLTAAIAFGVYAVSYTNQVMPAQILDDKEVEISGTVCDIPFQQYNKYYYVIETDAIAMDGAPQKVKMQLSVSKALEVDAYDRVTGTARLYVPVNAEGTTEAYRIARGILLAGYLDEYQEIKIESPENKPVNYYIIKFRQKLLSNLRILLPEKQASLAGGILLGDKKGVDAQISADFKKIGVAHILAVSGMHLAVISQFSMIFLTAIKIPKRFSALLSACGVFFFMALVGFVPSVVRAGIMSIIYLIGVMFSRQSDSINSLGAAVLILSLVNPFAPGDVGLLLSAAATLGIILLERPVENWMKARIGIDVEEHKVLNILLQVLAVSISATIFTLPITILTFGWVSLISPISNIFLVVPSTMMMFCTVVALGCSFLGNLSFLAMPAALASGMLSNYLIACSHFLAGIPFASVPATQPFMVLWISGTLLLLAVAIFLSKSIYLIKAASLLSAILLFTGILSYQITQRNVTHLAVIDSGNGMSVALTKNGHGAVLSCGGEKYRTKRLPAYLEEHNVFKLDYFLASDPSDETSFLAKELIDTFRPAALVLSDEEKLKEKIGEDFSNCGRVTYFKKRAEAELWENVKISAVQSQGRSCIYLKINDVTVLLCPKKIALENIPEEWRNCDFLITSATPEDDLIVAPAYTILSMNLETAEKIVEPLALSGQNVLATAGDGTISIDFKEEKNLEIRRER